MKTLLIFFIFFLLGVFLIVLSGIPFFNIESESGRFTLNSLINIYGALLIVWGLHINEKSLKEIAKTNVISEKGHDLSRYNSALDHFSNKNSVIAISGLFELEEIAKVNSKLNNICFNLLKSRLSTIGNEINNIVTDENSKNCEIRSLYDIRDNILKLIIERGMEIFKIDEHSFENVDFSSYTFEKSLNNVVFNKCIFRNSKFKGDFSQMNFLNCHFEQSIYFENKNMLKFENCWFKGAYLYYLDFKNVELKILNYFDDSVFIKCSNIEKMDISNIEYYNDCFVQEKLERIYEDNTDMEVIELFKFINSKKQLK